jgi:uncharacterized protein (TIGR04255 family)
MSTLEVFPNAPIREAIIDIQFESSLLSFEIIEDFVDKLSNKYAVEERDIIRDHQFKIQLNSDGASFENSFGILGLKVSLEDKSFILQFKTNGFSISQLSNYQGWNNFTSQAKVFWNLFSDRASKIKQKRIAVRYINDIDLPIDTGPLKLSDYLTIEPRTPNGLTDTVSNFFSKVEIPCELKDTSIIVVQASQGTNERSLKVLLDFDVYTTIKDNLEVEEMWAHIEKLRDIKNKAFKGSLTEKSREIFR